MGLELVRLLAEHQLDDKIKINRHGGTPIQITFKRKVYKPRI